MAFVKWFRYNSKGPVSVVEIIAHNLNTSRCFEGTALYYNLIKKLLKGIYLSYISFLLERFGISCFVSIISKFGNVIQFFSNIFGPDRKLEHTSTLHSSTVSSISFSRNQHHRYATVVTQSHCLYLK